MDQSVTQFVSLLKQSDLAALKVFYQQQPEATQTKLQLFLALQASKSIDAFDYFQLLSVKLSDDITIPLKLISQIKNINNLSFFTPLLQTMANFAVQDDKKRNVLHYLFVARGSSECVPFTYLRSLLLFESNLFLPKALIQTESNNLTPLECYLHLNIQGNELPDHELTAFMALIEIEQSQRPVISENLAFARSRFQKQINEFELSTGYIEQKALLLASYYGVSINDIKLNVTV